jgi:hypothetical protein
MRNKYVLVICMILVLDLIVGFTTRLSFVDVDKIPAETLQGYEVVNAGGIFSNDAGGDVTLNSIMNDADCIIKAEFTGERKYLAETCLAAVKVEQCYKGDGDLEGKIVYIFEPSYFNFENKLYFPYNGYNLMKTGEEYVLFLKRWQYSKYMQFNPYYKDKAIFVLPHNSAIDKYSTAGASFDKIIGDEQFLYGDVAEYEFFAYSKDDLDKYNTIKEDVLKQFNLR